MLYLYQDQGFPNSGKGWWWGEGQGGGGREGVANKRFLLGDYQVVKT